MKCKACRKDEAILTLWERTRNWFFNLFSQDVIDLAQEKYTLGFGEGYSKACVDMQNVSPIAMSLERLNDKFERAMRPLSSEYKLGAIEAERVITNPLVGGKPVLMVGGKPLSPVDKEQLVKDADYFTRSTLWRIMQETVKHMAVEDAVTNSTKWEQTLSGKMMLHNLGIQQKIIELILKKK
jgi:hypothetical protein